MNGGVDEATAVVERIREEVASHRSPGYDSRLRRELSISPGVAHLTVEMKGLEEIVEAAGREMYRAKRAGKNRVSVAR